MLTGHSLATAGAKALDVLGYRRMLRIEWAMEWGTRGLAPREGLRIEPATLAEFATLRGHPTPMAEAERRCAAGQRIFGVWHEGRMVYASWLATGSIYQPYLRTVLPLGPRDIYQYESWMVPELRGAGLASQTSIALLRLAEEEGINRLVTHVWPDNVVSLRLVYRNLGRATGVDMAFRLPGGRVVHVYRPWKEPLVAWEKPSGLVGRARHLWFVRYALARAGSA